MYASPKRWCYREDMIDKNKETLSEKEVNLNILFGIKAGMTRIFDDSGRHVPVTVIQLISNYITQIKTISKDGYSACQVAYGEKREKLVRKPLKGILKKASVKSFFTKFSEIRLDVVKADTLGKTLDFESFSPSSFVDVTGKSKGKGFQGVMKRYNFKGGPAAHGSHFHRGTGSIGNRATPGKVFKLKKMPGQMGNKNQTVQNIEVIEVNKDMSYLLLKGSIPGHKNGFVKITRSIKKMK